MHCDRSNKLVYVYNYAAGKANACRRGLDGESGFVLGQTQFGEWVQFRVLLLENHV